MPSLPQSIRGAAVAATILLGAAVAAGCGAGLGAPRDTPGAGAIVPTAAPDPVSLRTDRIRQSAGPVVSGGPAAPYNYGPSVLFDGGRYRVWWCSQLPDAGPPGDDVLYAEGPSPGGPFTAGTAVYSGSGSGFDTNHTCDPSVVKANGTYYLYYTGSPAEDHTRGNSIGVATSADGLHWNRLPGDHPIIGPSADLLRDNHYGVGQPAAVFLDGWFYVMFTDTTGRAAGWNGAGQFVLRSRNPLFSTGVESLGEHGFAPVPTTHSPRTRTVVDAFSADLMFLDALDAFAIAHEVDGGTQITFWNRDFSAETYRPVLIAGGWVEGPGLVRRSDGHAPISADDPCHRVPIDLLRATRGPAAPTDIVWFGLDLTGIDGCRTPANTAAVLAGVGVPAPDRTIDVIIGGKRVRVERRSVAAVLAGRVLDQPIPFVDTLPLLARLPAGVPAVRAPDRPAGLIIDGRLWPASDALVTQDSAPIGAVAASQWDAYPKGTDLRAVP